MASGILAALRVTLGLDTAAFEGGATRAERRAEAMGNKAEALGYKVGRLGKVLAGAGAALVASSAFNAIRDMAKEGLELAGSLGEQATQLGVSTSALQRYRYIATQVGIEQDEMDKGLAKVSLSLGKLALDPDKAAKSLAKYGFSAAEAARLSKMSAEDALPYLADKYKSLASETERAAFVAEFFGSKMGAKFKTLLEGGAKAIDEYAAAYKRLKIEISPEQIAAADKALDEMAQNQVVLNQRLAQITAGHAPEIARASLAWGSFKIQAVAALGSTISWLQRLDGQVAGAGRGFYKFFDDVHTSMRGVGLAVREMVSDIFGSMGARLSKILEGAKAKFAAVKDAAFDMWDKVTRRSYVPDMVDDIAREMARLDTVMVGPADRATESVKEKFQRLAADVRPMLDRLFPESRRLAQYLDELGKVVAASADGAISKPLAEAIKDGLFSELPTELQVSATLRTGDFKRLAEQFVAMTPSIKVPDNVRDELAKVAGAANDNADKTEAANVRIARSFKDMAEETVSKLQSMVSAIKSGGFLGILEGVIGFGLQLGSIGAFGKGIATRINSSKIPGYAGGTGFHPGGLALVGERGPELVNLPRGSQVWPNGSGPGGMAIQVLPSRYFDVRVMEHVGAAAPRIAAAGGEVGYAKVARAGRRRLA